MKISYPVICIALLLILPSPILSAQHMVWIGEGGYLGVQLRDITAEDARDLGLAHERGVYIEEVVEDSPADEAGIQEGDVILSFSGLTVLSVRQFQRLVSDTPPGRKVTLEVWRNKKQVDLRAEIGRRKGTYSIGGIHAPQDQDEEFHFKVEPEIEKFIMRARPGYRSPSKQRLGIQAAELTGQMAEFLGVPDDKGVLVMEVIEDSPAEKAGLKAGDVIISLDGREVDTLSDLSRRLSDGEHQLEIIRNRSRQALTVDLGSGKSKEKSDKILRL